jgi:hypothetical protein
MERSDFEQWKGKEVARLLALVETERRYYQEMVATLPVGVAVLSGDRSIVLANRAFRQMFGIPGREIRRKTIEQILPSDQLVEKIRAVHLETGAGGGLLLEFAGKLLRVDVRPIRGWDEDMELETLLAVQDLSEAGAPGAATIVVPAPPAAATVAIPAEPVPPPAPAFPNEDLPAIVWQADADTLRFTAVSGSAHSALGFPISHWLETEGFFEQRIHAEDRDAAMTLYRSIIERGSEASAEFRMVTSSGEPRWCRETVVVAPPAEGPRKIYGVLTLIGERVRMQRQMDVAGRHAALSGMSARLAHDLNNPLMLIAGYAEEMAHAFPEGDPRRDDLDQILKATERITEVTSHLLRFSRRGPTHPESVDLSAALARLEARFAGICGEGVALKIEMRQIEMGKPVWALADVRPLEELLVTLADAARDCTGCTELKVVYDSAAITERIPDATLAPGGYARVTVQGNGTGLDAIKSVSLFESILSKGAESARGESLARAYALAREWGGDLAYSGDAAHSTFVLYLRPCEPVEAPPQEIPVAQPEPPRPLILVVDDEPGIRALVAKILRREGYEVIEASTTTEAGGLAGVQARPVELLVTDVMLPDQPGTQLAEQLLEQLPALKVLYMSGYTEDERAHAGDFPPGAKFLQKPFTLSALVAKVRQSLEEA